MTILKTLKYKYCLILGTCHKYVVQFTDPTPTIFCYAKRAKLTFLNMPVLYTIQKNNVCVSGHVSNAMYNLLTGLAQFTGQ